MYNVSRQPIFDVKSKIYIAKKNKEWSYDENGNEITTYQEPKSYRFNIQNLTTLSTNRGEIESFGNEIEMMKLIVITDKKKYLNKFSEFDKVYVDTVPENEYENGANADYYIYSVINQNTVIKVYLKKISVSYSN